MATSPQGSFVKVRARNAGLPLGSGEGFLEEEAFKEGFGGYIGSCWRS